MKNIHILNWLQALIHERFGNHFTLSESKEGYLHLSTEGSSQVIDILSDPVTFMRADSNLPFTQWSGSAEGWAMPLTQPLPAPGASSLRAPLIEKTATGFTIHYDILGLTYWMLSRQEEVHRTDLDTHGRFPATSSHAYKHGYLERPVVDEWLMVLRQVMQQLWPNAGLIEHHYFMRVSHDVDEPSRYGFVSPKMLLRIILSDALKHGSPVNAIKAPFIRLQSGNRLHPSDPANTFDWIMDMSEQHGLTSAFYFICGRTDAARDASYEPEHPAIRSLMRRIHSRGHEIGLHPSYNAYQCPDTIVNEAQRLKNICMQEGIAQNTWGGRMHYLRWETPTTLYGWEEAGMSYDSSLSYADRPGFRCGTSFEYPAFDPVLGKALQLRLRPLIAMERTIMAPQYLNLGTSDAALKKFVKLQDACRAVKGSFTLLWHNSRFNHQTEKDLYTRLLASTPGFADEAGSAS